MSREDFFHFFIFHFFLSIFSPLPLFLFCPDSLPSMSQIWNIIIFPIYWFPPRAQYIQRNKIRIREIQESPSSSFPMSRNPPFPLLPFNAENSPTVKNSSFPVNFPFSSRNIEAFFLIMNVLNSLGSCVF